MDSYHVHAKTVMLFIYDNRIVLMFFVPTLSRNG